MTRIRQLTGVCVGVLLVPACEKTVSPPRGVGIVREAVNGKLTLEAWTPENLIQVNNTMFVGLRLTGIERKGDLIYKGKPVPLAPGPSKAIFKLTDPSGKVLLQHSRVIEWELRERTDPDIPLVAGVAIRNPGIGYEVRDDVSFGSKALLPGRYSLQLEVQLDTGERFTFTAIPFEKLDRQ